MKRFSQREAMNTDEVRTATERGTKGTNKD